MSNQDYFWLASAGELKKGYYQKDGYYHCLFCNTSFEKGRIHFAGDQGLTAKKAVITHIRQAHISPFHYFLAMGKNYTGLTLNQKNLIALFHEGFSDKEIAEKTNVSPSTVRNQRFSFKEKYKQAKIICALSELLDEEKQRLRGQSKEETGEDLIDIHHTAVKIDERYAITQAEQKQVLSQYFNGENRLLSFPTQEKKKIIILQHIIKAFQPSRVYHEKEVNSIIGSFYGDIPTIRRYLVEYGFLDRQADGAAYWIKTK